MKKYFKILGIILMSAAVLFAAAFAVFPLPGQVPVLMYHFVGTHRQTLISKNYVEAKSLGKQMEFLKRFGYHVISIEELYEIRTGRRKPRGREVAITFDDGNVSFAAEALPVFKKYEYPVMLFLVTEPLKHEAHGSMSVGAVKELLKNPWISIGGHTRTHPILSELSESQLQDEIANSKIELEQIFGRPVSYLAYPSGDFNASIRKMTQEAGYRLAFTTSPKKLKTSDIGPFAMTRVKISGSADNPVVFWFKISGIYEAFKLLRHQSKDVPPAVK